MTDNLEPKDNETDFRIYYEMTGLWLSSDKFEPGEESEEEFDKELVVENFLNALENSDDSDNDENQYQTENGRGDCKGDSG